MFAPSRLRVSTLSIAMLLLCGCASTARPVLYPDGQQDMARADTDLLECRGRAEAAVGMNDAMTPKKRADVARRGAMEFVDKAVERVVSGSRNVWARASGAGAGAMAGSVTSVALNWNEPDGVYREYVDLCLKERGHKVLGWR